MKIITLAIFALSIATIDIHSQAKDKVPPPEMTREQLLNSHGRPRNWFHFDTDEIQSSWRFDLARTKTRKMRNGVDWIFEFESEGVIVSVHLQDDKVLRAEEGAVLKDRSVKAEDSGILSSKVVKVSELRLGSMAETIAKKHETPAASPQPK